MSLFLKDLRRDLCRMSDAEFLAYLDSVRFLERDRVAKDIQELVFDALGQASMAWSEVPSGVFDSEKCSALGEQIIAAVRGEQA